MLWSMSPVKKKETILNNRYNVHKSKTKPNAKQVRSSTINAFREAKKPGEVDVVDSFLAI